MTQRTHVSTLRGLLPKQSLDRHVLSVRALWNRTLLEHAASLTIPVSTQSEIMAMS